MEALSDFFVTWGYAGLFLAAFVAGSILPFSSEVVMVILLRMGLDPLGCLLAASTGNTLGGMTCYGIGRLGKREWIARLGLNDKQMARASRLLEGRGAWFAFFAFLPYVGEAIALLLGLMRSNRWIILAAMFLGKLLRYAAVLWTLRGAEALL